LFDSTIFKIALLRQGIRQSKAQLKQFITGDKLSTLW